MFIRGLLVTLFLANVAEIKGSTCDLLDISKHKHYHLLPRKPVCGKKLDDQSPFIVSGRILNGTEIKLGEFPWLVHLEVQRKYRASYGSPWRPAGVCSGTLISNRYIVSVAHCFRPLRDYLMKTKVKLGGWKLDNSGKNCQQQRCAPPRVELEVDDIIRHGQFNRDSHNDITLLRLRGTVQFNEFLSPICLPSTCYWQGKDLECHEMTVAGWGFTRVQPWIANPNIANKLVVTGVSQQYCQDQYKNKHQILDSQLCAGGEPWKSPCKGDSGAPVMLEEIIRGYSTYYLVGAVSYGWPCHQQGESYLPPHVYTRVSHYVRWILDNIKP